MSVAVLGYALTTLSAVQGELGDCGVSEQRLARAINEATETFNRLIDRTLHYRAGYVERVASSGGVILQVWDALPIASISGITLDYNDGGTPVTVDPSTYALEDANLGFIRRLNGQGWIDTEVYSRMGGSTLKGTDRRLRLYAVTYTGGYVTPKQEEDTVDDPSPLTRTLPYDIERGVLDFVRMRVAQSRAGDPTVAAIGFDKGSITWARTADGQRVQVPLTMSEAAKFYAEGRAV